jgi:hypothetical protein
MESNRVVKSRVKLVLLTVSSLVMKQSIIIFLVTLVVVSCFRPLHFGSGRIVPAHSSSARSSSSGTWQQDVEKILDVDSTCDERKEMADGLKSKVKSIKKDVREALRSKNLDKVAPDDTKYGKDLRGLLRFKEQLKNDIIPELVFKGVPALINSGPSLAKRALAEAGGPPALAKQAQAAVDKVTELRQDPSALQYALDEVRREVRNVVKSTPEGLDTPSYAVVKSTDVYEIREYAPFVVASTTIQSNEEAAEEAMASGNGFNKLARYVLEGDNDRAESMGMTTPVMTSRDSMSFIMPSSVLTAESAPVPTDGDVQIKEMSRLVVAVRAFTGLVTEKETRRQREALEDALAADGIEYVFCYTIVLPPFSCL